MKFRTNKYIRHNLQIGKSYWGLDNFSAFVWRIERDCPGQDYYYCKIVKGRGNIYLEGQTITVSFYHISKKLYEV